MKLCAGLLITSRRFKPVVLFSENDIMRVEEEQHMI
jgi:hypothetical protein